MKILQIGKYYPPVKGGMESVLRDLCEGLLEAGHEVTALVAAGEEGARREAILDGRGLLVRCGTPAVVASQPLTLTLLQEIRTAASRWCPDVVQIHMPNPLAAACLLASRSCFPESTALTVWHHADVSRQRIGRLLVRPLSRRLLKVCDGVCVSSEELRKTSAELAPVNGKVRVIPFGIEPDRWTPGDPAAAERFLFVGRLVYYKGLDILLDALHLTPRASVRIVGAGPLGSALENRVAAEGLADRVEFLGECDDTRLRVLMADSRALIFPSSHDSETFGVVQLEAMSAGLPVISTRLATGVVSVNKHEETGLVVPPGDVPALAAAMTRCLDDPLSAVTWGEAGRRRVQDAHHRDEMVANLLDWYRSLLARS